MGKLSDYVDPGPTSAWEMPNASDLHSAAWRDAYFATQLANVTALHLWGVPLLEVHPTLRADIRSFADSFTEDVIDRYAHILNAVEGSRR